MAEDVYGKLGKRIGNIESLPKELTEQLKSYKVNDDERVVVAVIKEIYEGMATIDEILVGIYRRKGKVEDRAALARMIHRLVKSGNLEPVKQRKGAYKIAS